MNTNSRILLSNTHNNRVCVCVCTVASIIMSAAATAAVVRPEMYSKLLKQITVHT